MGWRIISMGRLPRRMRWNAARAVLLVTRMSDEQRPTEEKKQEPNLTPTEPKVPRVAADATKDKPEARGKPIGKQRRPGESR
ncbi:MAG: hypothetical protein ACO1OB_24810 [Archangium sp.]